MTGEEFVIVDGAVPTPVADVLDAARVRQLAEQRQADAEEQAWLTAASRRIGMLVASQPGRY